VSLTFGRTVAVSAIPRKGCLHGVYTMYNYAENFSTAPPHQPPVGEGRGPEASLLVRGVGKFSMLVRGVGKFSTFFDFIWATLAASFVFLFVACFLLEKIPNKNETLGVLTVVST
jgi:hypothetical protein